MFKNRILSIFVENSFNYHHHTLTCENYEHQENIRPNALLSSLSKVFKRIVFEKIQAQHVDKIFELRIRYEICQSHSTTLQLIKLLDELSLNHNDRL